ncbi:MAG: TPM domain-containing protein [Calditrichia bacterium]
MNRSSNPARFFSDVEKQAIVNAIGNAEKATSGEIRLHLEKSGGKDIFQKALEVFHKIGMQQTEQRNGVLIFLATADQKFAILGDEGINKTVPENFWEDVVQVMQQKFRQEDFVGGISKGVEMIGEKLKTYFPHQTDDINELSDDISIKTD